MKNKGFKTLLILDVLAVIFLFFAYGPISYFRELLITTAMTTKDHKYLARILYSEKTIAKVTNKNYIEEVNENTNSNEIKFQDLKETDKYDSEYEEQVLKKGDNDLYKIVQIT